MKPKKPKSDPSKREHWMQVVITGVRMGKSVATTLREAQVQDPAAPHLHTVYTWRDQDPAFKEALRVARGESCDAIEDKILEIADSPTEHEDDVPRRKLQIDVRTRLLGWRNRAEYGPHQHVEHEGGMSIQVVTGVPDPLEPTKDAVEMPE